MKNEQSYFEAKNNVKIRVTPRKMFWGTGGPMMVFIVLYFIVNDGACVVHTVRSDSGRDVCVMP